MKNVDEKLKKLKIFLQSPPVDLSEKEVSLILIYVEQQIFGRYNIKQS
jgi:hypothetical protein